MDIFKKVARGTVVFVTLGALTIVWSSVWLAYLLNTRGADPGVSLYWGIGFLLTGIVFVGVGMLIVAMGRRATEHEMDVEEKAVDSAANVKVPSDADLTAASYRDSR